MVASLQAMLHVSNVKWGPNVRKVRLFLYYILVICVPSVIVRKKHSMYCENYMCLGLFSRFCTNINRTFWGYKIDDLTLLM